MYIHISFLIPNSYGNYLLQIIDNSNLSKLKSIIYHADIIKLTGENLLVKSNKVYETNELKSLFKEPQYLLFLKAAFFDAVTGFDNEIDSIDMFLKSSCSTMIFVTDSSIVNIITKDKNIEEQFTKIILKYSFVKIDTDAQNDIDVFDFF